MLKVFQLKILNNFLIFEVSRSSLYDGQSYQDITIKIIKLCSYLLEMLNCFVSAASLPTSVGIVHGFH